MNKGWQKNSWIFAPMLLVQGATGILQAYIDSKHQPEAALFVPELILFSLVLGLGRVFLRTKRLAKGMCLSLSR